MKPAEYIPRAEDGHAAVMEAVTNAAGANSWSQSSVQSFLLGEHHGGTRKVWTLGQLQVLDDNTVPCWVLKTITEPGGPRVVFWANRAARKKLGPSADTAAVLQYFEQLPPKYQAPARQVLKTLHDTIVVWR